ncbi:DNA methyltransferase [Clostridium sp. UBA1353]|uniref:DNA methyltransferase n=1 Tax=Clostridium sp. UBA1353 TaxID=1946347 RepID=UPI00321792E2
MFEKGNLENQPIVVENLPLQIIEGSSYSIAQPNPNSFTHGYFKYPCKFIPEIPRWAIRAYSKDENDIVFDPFSGSGTTLLESLINNRNAYGTEIDGIAKLIIKVKTTFLSEEKIDKTNSLFNSIIERISDEDIAPLIPEINNITHWFSEENINKLGKLRKLIEQIDDIDIRDFFKVCFVSIIKKCSYSDDISPKPYVSSRIKKIPAEPVIEFSNTFDRYIEGMKELSKLNTKKETTIVDGDALKVKFSSEVDLVITSPPYINAFDYGRTLRLENLWLGILTEEELRIKKKYYVGTEKVVIKEEEEKLNILEDSKLLRDYFEKINSIDKKRALIVKKFFDDMKTNLIEMHRILKSGGYYCIVIGNSSIRNVEVESWKVLGDISLAVGYTVETYFSYIIQNPYIRIPRSGKGGKINSDYVLVLKKNI